MHEATFAGGPLDGLTYEIRSDLGVLAVDVEQEPALAWLYQPKGDGTLEVALCDDPAVGDPFTGTRMFNEDRAFAAAEAGYDVISVPGREPTQEEIDDEDEPEEDPDAE